jgi:flagellar basal body-associated protein FliL
MKWKNRSNHEGIIVILIIVLLICAICIGSFCGIMFYEKMSDNVSFQQATLVLDKLRSDVEKEIENK